MDIDLLEYLIAAHNIRNEWDRSPAISNEKIDRIIKDNIGDKKIFEITYSLFINNAEIVDSIYILAESLEDSKLKDELDWYINTDIYHNVKVHEKIFD